MFNDVTQIETAEVGVVSDSGISNVERTGPNYVPLTEDEERGLMEILLGMDLSEAEVFEGTDLPFASDLKFQFLTEEDEYVLILQPYDGANFQGFSIVKRDREGTPEDIMASMEKKLYKVPLDTYSEDGVITVRDSIWANTEDGACCGEVKNLETREHYKLWKKNVVLAGTIFDRALHDNSTEAGNSGDVSADMEIVLNGVTYLYDSTSGDFSVDFGDGTMRSNTGYKDVLNYQILHPHRNVKK